MRLHALTMTAIGPYAETERVDFDALAGDGLFLFAGPTGAGKTTVLDAVTFALYGRLPGTREGQLSRLKSDFAAADVRPEVVLELTVGAERLRVHRSPSYERPKKRGDGTTTERASVAIERQVDGAWIGVEGARKENVANDWLAERLGLTCDQFTQVVLLPQGQFAEFLHASDDVREKLLVSLFNAHRFKDVEDWFDDRQRTEAAVAADAEEKVTALRTKAQAVADLGDDDLPEAVDVEWFASLADSVRARSDEAEIRVDVAARLHEEAAERLLAAEDVVRRQQELTEARRLHEIVEVQRDDIATLRSRYERAVAAASVAPLLIELDRRRSTAEGAAAQAAASRQALLATEPDLAEQPVDAARARLRALTSRRGALDDVIAAEREIAGQRAALEAATEALA
ncbi:AAA family ATPase, partial [Cumulibacter manganitolerans]|uniref:AAA family ATPase n=1 Tax=Cumulibacter manganitolerans TaxID=1884992 RepID=UPI0012955E37